MINIDEFPIDAAVASAVRRLGLDTVMYAQVVDGPSGPSILTIWSNDPREWTERYVKMEYEKMDPRLRSTAGCAVPMIWDTKTFAGLATAKSFVQDAASFGIRSGIATMFCYTLNRRAFVAYNSSIGELGMTRRTWMVRHLGDMMLLAAQIHEMFVSRSRRSDPGCAAQVGRISARERQCLHMVAHGLTSADIGLKLEIAERTVNFHLKNAFGKLAVLNRNEAIAKAITRGIIQVGA